MNTECALYLCLRPTKTQKGIGGLFTLFPGVKIDAHSVLQLIVFLARHYRQIVKRVVCSVSVFMMNNFVAFKRTANRLFNKMTVFVNSLLSTDAQNFVTSSYNFVFDFVHRGGCVPFLRGLSLRCLCFR